MPLMFLIQGGPMRFGQLKRALNHITEQMLTKQLRELEKHNLIERKDYKTVPPKVEYCLTDFGRIFSPIISQFHELGKRLKRRMLLLLQLGECRKHKSIYVYIF